MAQILAKSEEEDEEKCLHTSQYVPSISFTPDDMQVKGKHDRPLYFTGYISSSEVSCIQVDLGSALSIVPNMVMHHLGIPTHPPRLPFIASTLMVHTRWERSNSNARSNT